LSDLGTARGRITIDTSGVRAAQQQVQQASQVMNQALGAVGVSLGTAGAVQLARFVVESAKVATAFERQEVAALSLAGSQDKLNQLLDTYRAATGGAIDDAQALADVTRLQAIGFADSAAELDRFATAARGISLATGQSQDYVISQLQLAIANQSTMRLDQLGLGVSEVKQRIDELKASNKGLTDEMAYQQAILEAANDKFGALADSAAGQKTEVEKLETAWKNLRLEVGQTIGGNVNEVSSGINFILDALRARIQETNALIDEYEATARAPFASRTSIGRVTPTRIDTGAPAIDFEARAESTVQWYDEIRDIERQANEQRLDATRQYEEQRTSTIRQYGTALVREAEDFGRQRLRSEQDYAISLQRIHRDIAQREAGQLADLERTIADARTDAAERGAERQIALDERIAETREASQERIADMEEDFARSRERAQRAYADRLRDAAANLDAVAVREAQRDFRNSRKDAQEDFDERLQEERENEAERLQELNKAHAKQTADEGRALQKRIDDANAAYQRQLADARAADAQRLEDMAADRAIRLKRENEDRATRLARLAEDHAAQLTEMARAHGERMTQIAEQEAEELAAANKAQDERMIALGVHIAAVEAAQAAHEARALTAYGEHLAEQERMFNAMMTRPTPGLPDPFSGPIFGGNNLSSGGSIVSNSTNSNRNVTIQSGAITIVTPANFAADPQSRAWLHGELAQFLEDFIN
jgi:hypothetical protein